MLSQAEILKPGVALPTYDSGTPAKRTVEAMCNFKRKTLDEAKATDRGGSAIRAVVGDDAAKSFTDRSYTCDAVNYIFNSAATLIANENRGRASQPSIGANGGRNMFSTKAPSPAEINAKMRAAYAVH